MIKAYEKHFTFSTMLDRTIGMILAAPKIFLGSFGWEAFAMISSHYLGLNRLQFWYCLMTGIGATIGITIGHLAVVLLKTRDRDVLDIELHSIALLAVAAGLITGTLWQVSINISIHLHFDFTQTFFFVGGVSVGYSFVSLILLRYINTVFPQIFDLKIKPVKETLYNDFLVALSVGAADAFFCGTSDINTFANDWLPGFAVRSNTSIFVACCLAGSSSLCGFLVSQTIQNIVLMDTWVDVMVEEGLVIDFLDRLDAYNVTTREHELKSTTEERSLLKDSKPKSDVIP